MTELQALGRVLAHEIDRAVGPHKHGMPFQSKAAIYKRLEAQGLVERATVELNDFPRITISGWELTHAGRMIYCASCDESAEGDKP